jgi:hypothetical protein
VRLATKAAASKSAADVAAAPYACVVPDGARPARRQAPRPAGRAPAQPGADRARPAADIYDTEHALKVRIDGIENCEWGVRLQQLMDAIAALVSAEVKPLPLQCRPHSRFAPAARPRHAGDKLSYLAWKGRDADAGRAAAFRKLIGQT